MIHSDHGVQYACDEFREILKKRHFIQSMSRKRNCSDNAVATFSRRLKQSGRIMVNFHDIHQIEQEAFEYLAF